MRCNSSVFDFTGICKEAEDDPVFIPTVWRGHYLWWWLTPTYYLPIYLRRTYLLLTHTEWRWTRHTQWLLTILPAQQHYFDIRLKNLLDWYYKKKSPQLTINRCLAACDSDCLYNEYFIMNKKRRWWWVSGRGIFFCLLPIFTLFSAPSIKFKRSSQATNAIKTSNKNQDNNSPSSQFFIWRKYFLRFSIIFCTLLSDRLRPSSFPYT